MKIRVYRIGCVILTLILVSMILLGFKQKIELNTSSNISVNSYVTCVVEKGDTVWSIARKYPSEYQDIRKFVYVIEQVNEIKDAMIHPGQVLKIPQ